MHRWRERGKTIHGGGGKWSGKQGRDEAQSSAEMGGKVRGGKGVRVRSGKVGSDRTREEEIMVRANGKRVERP